MKHPCSDSYTDIIETVGEFYTTVFSGTLNAQKECAERVKKAIDIYLEELEQYEKAKKERRKKNQNK